MRFRECAQHHHFAAPTHVVESMRAIDAAANRKVLREIEIGLIQDDNHLVRNLVEKAIQFCCGNECAGWIVRIGYVDDTSMLVNGRGDRGQIKSIAAHRNLDKLSSSGLG